MNFRKTMDKMQRHVANFPQPRLAAYHYFTTCLPRCATHGNPRCGMTLGLAYSNGVNTADYKNENIGVNRFRGPGSFVFTHEMGHSLGFGHFFSAGRDRDVNDNNPATAYGVMDYGMLSSKIQTLAKTRTSMGWCSSPLDMRVTTMALLRGRIFLVKQ